MIGMEDDGFALSTHGRCHIGRGFMFDRTNPVLRLAMCRHEVVAAEMSGEHEAIDVGVVQATFQHLGSGVRIRL